MKRITIINKDIGKNIDFNLIPVNEIIYFVVLLKSEKHQGKN